MLEGLPIQELAPAGLVLAGMLLFFAFQSRRRAADDEREAEGKIDEVKQLDARPTTPAAKIHGPGRYEVQGRFEAAGEPLVAPCAKVPALWYRHLVVEERYVTHRQRCGDEYRTTVRLHSEVVGRDERAAPAQLRDESGAIRVDLEGGEPEGALVWDRRRPTGVGRVVAGLALVYVLVVLGLGLAADSRPAVWVALVQVALGTALLFGFVCVAATLVFFLWAIFAPMLPTRTRDRVWVIPPDSSGMVVAAAIPDPRSGRMMLGPGREPMIITRELEQERVARLMQEVEVLQRRAASARLGGSILMCGGLLVVLGTLLALYMTRSVG